NPDRDDHYEQAGIYIAERCALLIAVMPANEEPGRVGGTARIVDYRLRGADAIAQRIIDHSQVLRQRDTLDSPQTRPVWLIDLGPVGETSGDPLRSVSLWEPVRHPASPHGARNPVAWLFRWFLEPSIVNPGAPTEIRKTENLSDKGLIRGAALAVRT